MLWKYIENLWLKKRSFSKYLRKEQIFIKIKTYVCKEVMFYQNISWRSVLPLQRYLQNKFFYHWFSIYFHIILKDKIFRMSFEIFWRLLILKGTFVHKISYTREQAGAELGQAQLKLRLDF